MPTCDIRLDLSDTMDLVQSIASVAKNWLEDKRERFRQEFFDALEDGLDMRAENEVMVVLAGSKLYDVLNKYGLNPVC